MDIQADDIRKLLNNHTHSLLFSTKEEQDNWFTPINKEPTFQPLLEEIRIEANRLLREPLEEIPFSTFVLYRDAGSRLEYETVYFAKRRRLNTYAIMALLEPDSSIFLTELQNIIWSICNEYTWCLSAHIKYSAEMDTYIEHSSLQGEHIQQEYTIDLFAAETAFTLSEIYKLTENMLDPLIQKRMVDEVFRRVLKPYYNQSPFEWETATHNWASVCAGSIGSAALNLIEDKESLSIILERVIKSMDCYLAGFKDDGACTEGYGYWQYGFGYYTYFADLLYRKTEGSINLFQSRKVHQIALFQQKCFLHKNQVVNFSDSTQKGTVFLGLSHYLKKLYSDVEVPESELRASYTEDHCSRWAPALRNLLWFDHNENGEPWRDQSYYLEESQWFISRNTPYVFACKGGHNNEPHNHNDIGHFILQVNGETFLRDLGSGMYCDGYFGDERYSFLCNGSQGHSVPIINEQTQSGGSSHYATNVDVSIRDDIDKIEMDLAKAYEIDSLQKLNRTFIWKKDKNQELLLIDSYQFSEVPTSIVERFITPVLNIEEANDGIILEGERRLKITFDHHLLNFEIKKDEFINHAGEDEPLLIIDFSVREPRREVVVDFGFIFIES
ncbi:heparinase II/III domain-containing protein [Litchfieldia salsa]|uniref:Heparinase II/III-like protein n=1 Tax=Litchfieldia salsa TaxID=930152 RepID=A0A1H0Q6Y1_9BACI|nr:heparinase II/III family protein [Litchfieldia salsa]SDP12910.1 Heparinase II/III-like protein [Litchfieldia salsa]